MLYIKPVWIGILFTYFLHRHLITFVNGGSNTKAAAPYYLSDVAIDCGATVGNSTALDGREWVGEAASKFVSGKPRSSTAVDKSFLGFDPVPYMTSRISATPFHYTFPVNPGQKFIRLHFYPASYRGFEKSTDFFSVRAGPFTLLRDYSASLTADTLGVKYLVKEFCLNVEENELLKITFSPSQSSSKSKTNTYAFVNGIEIISMPSGLYYTPDGDLGAPIVGQHNRFYSIDNSTALELIQRLNIGGSSISPIEDFGMFRRWNEDTSYLLEARAHRVNHPVLKIKYTNMPAFIAPAKIYQTSWKSGRRIGVKQMYNFTWKVSVDLRFRYLVRLHFCELGSGMAEREPREFSVFINNQIAEINADVFRWSGDIGIPVYRDYILITKGGREGSKSDLLIGLQSVNELVFGLLNGLEIFKLSNLENSLAAPSLVFPNRVSSSRNLKIETFLSAFGQSNVIGTAMTVLIILLSIVTYNLRKFWEEKNFHDEIVAQSDSVEPSYRCFTLAEIKLATQNFNNAFVIGRGGFGKVYKGFIHGVSDAVAIKRLSSYSRQGAREFWTEIETLSKLRHIHLVSLIGYCNECQEMILVYEYIAGGTLADNLYKFARKGKDCAPLSWEQRLRICIGAARGLEYLHTGSEYGVIHRDVKDTNILLDENFVAKISDFGLSKLEKMTQSKNYVSTKVKGTVGYLDPDYVITHRLTRKSDVYAFGVVLLVVLSGRPALDASIPGETQSLLSCFRECLAEDNVNKIVDPCLQGEISPNRLREFVKSIENCLHQLPKKRPTMARVVAILEQALEQHGSSISAASADATVVDHPREEGAMQSFQLSHHKAPILEEGVISPPKEGVTSKQTQNLASPTVEKDLHLRGNDYTPVRKPVLGWTWKSFWSKVKKRKVVESFFEEQPLYGYRTLAIATHNFATENKLGVGGFGAVYKEIAGNCSVATKELTKSFGWDTYDSFMQHDVQELNRVLCKNLEDEMKGTVVEGTIQQLFEGHHMNYIECINVDYKSTRKESFYDLQLDVKGCRDVYASFDKYVEVERLEGDNKYHAEQYGLQDARKGVLFIDFPPVLQLQLKQFEYDFIRDTMLKINDRYKFPLELDLDRENGKYLSPEADRSVRNLYTLHSVLVHSGGVHGGHYYAYIRPTLSNLWFKFDDEHVTKEDIKTALEEQHGGEEELPQTNPGFNIWAFKFTKYSNAYMLVYIRESVKEKIICNVDEKYIAEHLRIRLKKAQKEKEQKRKEKAEAHLHTIIKVARDEDLVEQIGREIYFDLVDHDKVRCFRIQKQMPFNLFKEEVAKEFGIPVQCQRFWLWAKRQNRTYRPNRPLTPHEEGQSVGQLRVVSNKANNAELKLFLEVELGLDLQHFPLPDKSKDDILLFFKLYDPFKEELRYVGRLFVKGSGKPIEILGKLNELAGFAPDEDIELFEEIKFEPNVMCEHIDKKLNFFGSQLEDGDIICFQKSLQGQNVDQCRYPDVPSFLEYVHNRQVVRFRSLDKPKEDDFCLELSKQNNYDEVVESVARHLSLDDPSKIRLTSHTCYSQQPKPQPVKYKGVEHLTDMLIHYNQTSDILYYEVLDIPLPELQGLKTLKVAFHHATKDEVVIHTIRLPKLSTVGDVINDIKTKVELSHPNAELRLLEVFYNKIYEIFPLHEKIENINTQYWTLRAEEIPEEEKNLGPHDCLIHVYHFMKDTAQNQVQVQNFGEPFFLVIHEGETLADVKLRIQKKLQVPDEEFAKWKFAFLSLGRPEYLQDSDIVSTRFQRRGVWGQYLGLEHSDNAPKRSYAANQ